MQIKCGILRKATNRYKAEEGSTVITLTWQNDYDVLKAVVVKHAQDAYRIQNKINDKGRELDCPSPPQLENAVKESSNFITTLQQNGIEVMRLPSQNTLAIDSILRAR